MRGFTALAMIFFLLLGAFPGMALESLGGLELNETLLEEKGIRVFGGPGDVPCNEFSPLDGGYYRYQGREGEYRYHGFDNSFNLFTNRDFPNDADSYRALSMKHWLKEGWETEGYKPDPFQSYLREHTGLAADSLKAAYEEMLPFEIYGEGRVYDYLYISDFPTLYGPGQGILWHETPNGIWYQSFSLGILKEKLATPGELVFAGLEEEDYALHSREKFLRVTLHGRLLDETFRDSPVLGKLYYTREDIEDFTFTLGDRTATLPPNDLANSSTADFSVPVSPLDIQEGSLTLQGAFRVNYRDGSHSPWFSREVVYDFKQEAGYLQSYFNVGHIPQKEDLTLEDIAYHDLSKGDIDLYRITLSSWNRNGFAAGESFDVKQTVVGDLGTSTLVKEVRVIREDKGLDLTIKLPEWVYDLEPIEAENLTEMDRVVSKSVTLDGRRVDFDRFFKGELVHGEVPSDRLLEVVVTMKTEEGIEYTGNDWILVKSTVPPLNFKQGAKAVEGRWVDFTDEGGREDLRRDFPQTYTCHGEGLEIVEVPGGFKVRGDLPGVYTMRVTAESAVNQAAREFRVVVFEDLPPGIYVNLYTNQLYRGDTLRVDVAYVSLDGDPMPIRELYIEKDVQGDGRYVFDSVYDPQSVYDTLGDYRLVARAGEAGRSTEVVRDFSVDNRMPVTTLSVREAVSPVKVDLLMVGEASALPASGEIEALLRERGYAGRVCSYDPTPLVDVKTVTRDLGTGEGDPPGTLFFSEGGYEGTLSLNQVQDFGAYEEEGYYTTRTSCRSVNVYSRVRGCDICGTYYNALGHKFCKFCMVVTGTTTQCTRKKYWISEMVWHPDYLGTYSGEVTRQSALPFEDPFREDARTAIMVLEGADPGVWEGRAHEVVSATAESFDRELQRLYPPNVAAMTTVLVDEEFELLYGNFDAEGDPISREEFAVYHDPGVFDNPAHRMAGHGVYSDEVPGVFGLPGHYEIRRRIEDNPQEPGFNKVSGEAVVHLRVHRPPVADFKLVFDGGWQLVDLSYDPDYLYSREDRGIKATSLVLTDAKGTRFYGMPRELSPGSYDVVYQVEDIDGALGELRRPLEITRDPLVLHGAVHPGVLALGETVRLSFFKETDPGPMRIEVVSVGGDRRVVVAEETRASEVDFVIPGDFRDGSYYFEVTCLGGVFVYPFRVFSPINLQLLPHEGYRVRATVAPYVREVYLVKGETATAMAYEEGVYSWLTQGEDRLKVRGVLHEKSEELRVVFPLEPATGAVITLKGSWQYWRGQKNLLGEQLGEEPDRFMALEGLTVEVGGLSGEGVLYFDEALGLEPVAFDTACEVSLVLPLLKSSLSPGGERLREPYRIWVKAGEEVAEKTFEITGNIYDRIYLQPDF